MFYTVLTIRRSEKSSLKRIPDLFKSKTVLLTLGSITVTTQAPDGR